MTAPKRIQLRRTKGWRKPEGAVVVARPSRWGNPWTVGQLVTRKIVGEMRGGYVGDYAAPDRRQFDDEQRGELTADEAVRLYRDDLLSTLADNDTYFDELRASLQALRGRDLACWCPLDAPCHADVLLELANR